jgi:hypothetical protein
VPALNLTEPAHLLAKLKHEFETLSADHGNSYAAINAIQDAYHLREWVWHGRLENDAALQLQIMAKVGHESDWNEYVNRQFTDFPLVRDLCNGSKHFEPDPKSKVQATHPAGYGSCLMAYGDGVLGYGVGGFFVQVDAGCIISVHNLIERVFDFWAEIFRRYPQLT